MNIDFTYVATWQGFVYLTFVIDDVPRIVGQRASWTAYAGFVLDAQEQLAKQGAVQRIFEKTNARYFAEP